MDVWRAVPSSAISFEDVCGFVNSGKSSWQRHEMTSPFVPEIPHFAVHHPQHGYLHCTWHKGRLEIDRYGPNRPDTFLQELEHEFNCKFIDEQGSDVDGNYIHHIRLDGMFYEMPHFDQWKFNEEIGKYEAESPNYCFQAERVRIGRITEQCSEYQIGGLTVWPKNDLQENEKE